MKIIGKIKDYYDYLQGIYGVDSKLILDRPDFEYLKEIPFDNTGERLVFHICDRAYECLYLNGKFLYGAEIKAVCAETDNYWKRQGRNYVFTKDNGPIWSQKTLWFNLESDIPSEVNIKENCPIIRQHIDSESTHAFTSRDYNKFPILSQYDFQKAVKPEDMWIMLSNWLSKPVELKDTMTNKEKILSHGFDIKHSFRNTK